MPNAYTKARALKNKARTKARICFSFRYALALDMQFMR
jgi:hypothetical protein